MSPLSSTEDHFAGSGPMLWAASPALPAESLASWVQRLCGGHQYSMPLFMAILGFEPVLRDWDLPLPLPVWQRLRSMVRFDHTHQWESLHTIASLYPHIDPDQLRWHGGNTPCSAWCQRCLASDETPYLRWTWRLAALDICSLHGERLSSQCPACASPLLLHTSRLVPIGAYGCAVRMGDCACCGMPLALPEPTKRKAEKSKPKWRPEPVLDAIRMVQYFRDEGATQRALGYFASQIPKDRCHVRKSCLRQLAEAGVSQLYPYRPCSDGPDFVQEIEQRRSYETAWLRQMQSHARLLAAQAQAQDASGQVTKTASEIRKKIHWSWKLSARKRIDLARALRLIRQEKRAMRAEQGVA